MKLIRCTIALFAATIAVTGCASPAADPAPRPGSPSVATLVVPRFNGGSLPTDPESRDQFWTRRGFPAAELQLGPTYDQLISDLAKASGSAERIIGASYDWRMPGAPPQPLDDGKVEGLLAHWNDPQAASEFEYAVDYLRYWLAQAAAASPGSPEVNVVAHSTGVSVVRAYLQSDAYGQSVLAPDGTRITLPKIGKLILASPPQEGAPFVWNLWNGNFASFRDAARGADVFAGYTRAYRFVLAGGTITGPAGDITRADLKGKGLARQVSFLRAYNPLFRIVLPTSPFLYPVSQAGQNPATINDTANRNELLLDLNADSEPGRNPWTSLAGSVTVTYPVHVLADPSAPDSGTVPTNVMDQAEKGTGGQIMPFTAFASSDRKTIPTAPGQLWYREIFEPDNGDGAFPQSSMQRMFFTSTGQPDGNITIQQWGNGASPQTHGKESWVSADGNLSHNLFIENPQITAWISSQIAD